MTLSTNKAKYMSLSAAVQEASRLKSLDEESAKKASTKVRRNSEDEGGAYGPEGSGGDKA